ncbi:GDSL-type esterase/lipase family protein [Thalassoroseus pseudoceratinae]|uniref:GDSL-type esterase/lipase family protein n=1 Tax=Thalassoroseus pseudoceratinae TaxID=2713176 RepID=UPI0014204C94|nr:GDSL-type esterase/lipase family protein [Thalassoroseus pseudoceratinae]
MITYRKTFTTWFTGLLTGLLVSLTTHPGLAEERDLLIVAGQSNAVGYDAKPSELPSDDNDSRILFWWRTGDPPPDVHDSSSGQKWTHLQPQSLGNPKRPKEGRQYGNFAQKEGGFGPEIGLARTLQTRTKRPLAIVKVAFSGTGLRQDWNPNDPGDGGSCYRALIEEVRTAIEAGREQGITLKPKALAWVQGESDANSRDAANYANALREMLAALRRDLETPDLLALVAVNTRFGNGENQFMPIVVEQQKRVAATDPLCEYMDTSSATIANAAHFDSSGTLEVGRMFADSLLRLESKLTKNHRHLTIVTLGDSITKGVRSGVTSDQTFAALLESQLPEGVSGQVVNVGIGGERTDQAIKRLDRVLANQPDIVTIMYGTNDSYVDQGKSESRISVEAYRKNLTTIVSEMLRRGVQPILMTEPRWADDARSNGLGENPNIKLEPFMTACREVANEWRVPLVDHFAKWTAAETDGTNLRDWTTDGCHPNPTGHRKIAATIKPVLDRVIGPALKTRAKLMAGDPIRVVCFGDSVTGVYYHTGSRRAYTDMLGIALQRVQPSAKIEMINAGISGHTTVNALARIERDVLARKPDLVTVMFGLNDMTRVPIDQYHENLTQIVTQCREIGSEVVLATPNNVVSTDRRPTQKLIEYCDVIREVARELNVPICDCYRELDAVRTHSEFPWRLLMSDEIHPNMDGHQRIATALAQTITGLRISLDDVPPPKPALSHLRAKLKEGQPIRVLAMEPFDQIVESELRAVYPKGEITVQPWSVADQSLSEIRSDAEKRVRATKPDLVVIAVPRSATAASDLEFANSYAWIMNWSLNFGPPTWDCLVIHPSIGEPLPEPTSHDELIRTLVNAQDLHLLDRPTNSQENAETIIKDWFRQMAIE